jgi:DnaJ-class molecular chaperone
VRTDYYGALNVSKSANATEIKSKYRRLALQYHPDKLGHLTTSQQKSAEKIFKVPRLSYTLDTVSSSHHAFC